MKTKLIAILAILGLCAAVLAGCTEADRVTKQVSWDADNFSVVRKITVINTRDDVALLEITGRMSIKQSSGDVDIIVEVAPGVYRKHFVHLNSWITYVVEDMTGRTDDDYVHEIQLMPWGT